MTAPATGETPRTGGAIANPSVLRVALLLLLVGMALHEIVVRIVPGSGIWDDLVLLFLAGLLLLPSSWRGWGGRSGLLLPIAAYVVLTILSAIVNHEPDHAFLYGIRLVIPYLVVGPAAARLRTRDVTVIAHWVVGAAAAAALYGILSFTTFRAIGSWGGIREHSYAAWQAIFLYPYTCGAYPFPGWRLASTFMNDNFFGLWMAMVVPVGLALWLGESRPHRRALLLAAITMMLVAFAWTYSRSAALAFLAMGLFCFIGMSRRVWWIVVPVVVAAPLLAAPMDSYRFNPTHLRTTQGGRVQSVRKGLNVLRTHPFFGKGPGTRGLADLDYAKILYENGLLGFAAFLWLLYASVAPARKLSGLPLEERRIGLALTAGMAAMLVAAIGGDVWEIPQLGDYYWAFAGMLYALTAGQPAKEPPPA